MAITGQVTALTNKAQVKYKCKVGYKEYYLVSRARKSSSVFKWVDLYYVRSGYRSGFRGVYKASAARKCHLTARVTGSIPQEVETFPKINFSAHNTTELLKIKGDVQDHPEDVKEPGSDHPQGISAPSFRSAPLWVVGEEVSQPLQHRGCAD